MMKCVRAGVSHSVHGMKRVREGHNALCVQNAFAAKVNLGRCAALCEGAVFDEIKGTLMTFISEVTASKSLYCYHDQ